MTSIKTRTWFSIILSALILGLPAQAATFSESAGAFLTSPVVESLLLGVGVVSLVLAIITMGTGVAEFICFSSFVLLFAGRYLQGEELWLPFGLLAAGLLFAALEVFVMPGVGVCGMLSLVSLAGLSILIADDLQAGLTVFFASTLLAISAALLAMKYLPHLCITRKMFVLEPPKPTSAKPAAPDVMSVKPGDVGSASTPLRPAGIVLFGTERLDVVSEGEFIKKGTPVEVVRVEGHKVVVRSCGRAAQS